MSITAVCAAWDRNKSESVRSILTYCRRWSLSDAESDSRSLSHDDGRLGNDAKRSLICERLAFYDDSIIATQHAALRQFISGDIAVGSEVNTFWCNRNIGAEVFVGIRVNDYRRYIPGTVGRCTSCESSVSVRDILIICLPWKREPKAKSSDNKVLIQ